MFFAASVNRSRIEPLIASFSMDKVFIIRFLIFIMKYHKMKKALKLSSFQRKGSNFKAFCRLSRVNPRKFELL
ncbi:hypothetical protein ASF92_16035 [Pedobacter sp. Leaf176]|nr:hypothetical protein ASF92_16035 [Pedobacter sp. Leaf176]